MDNLLDEVVAALMSSAKYREISPALLRQIAAQELSKRRSLKEAVKAAKNKLHQIAGAYFGELPNFAAWQASLAGAAAVGEDLRPLCRQWLAAHASTRERVPLLEQFYTRLFEGLPPIYSLLDLACGLNPLTLPWMGLSPTTHYHACDLYQSEADFFNGVFPLLGVTGEFSVCNLLQALPPQAVDVALLLKTIPCLEQVDKRVGSRLIAEIDARVLIVSFPGRSLGGHQRGMAANYEAHFTTLMAGFEYRYDKIEFANEIVFRIFK